MAAGVRESLIKIVEVELGLMTIQAQQVVSSWEAKNRLMKEVWY